MQPTGSRLILYGDKDAEFSLYDVADIHFGNRGCAKHVLERDMTRIAKDPYSFWVLGGDYCDFIDWNDARFDPECVDVDMTVNDMAELGAWLVRGVMKFLLPIKDSCLGAGIGNHEKKYMTGKAQADIHETVCKGLESPDLKYSGWFDLYFEHRPDFAGCQLIKNPKLEQMRQPGQVRLRVLVHHGFSAAATSGGRMIALKKALDMVDDADLVMLGHLHEQIAKTNVRIGVDETCQTLRAKSSMGLITGTYLRTYSMNQTGYGEMRGYPPTTLGATRAVFIPAERVLTVENRADGIGMSF
jgi:hypothetical protein